MTTPEEAVRKYLKGIEAIPKEDPPQEVPLTFEEILEQDVRWKKLLDFADNLEYYLIKRGFRTHIYEYPTQMMILLDFKDPSLEEAITKIGRKIGKDSWYATIQSKGSMQIESYGDDHIRVSGDIPLSMLRPEDIVSGLFRQVLKDGRPAQITELHFHMWDHRPAVHIHVEGIDVDPVKLGEFIAKVRNISYKFATERYPRLE